MAVHLLGIRHHGPGSARNVAAYLQALQPDIILVEGPPEADTLLQFTIQQNMQPPVAILAYQPDAPENAVFYPFTVFSPEWQAITYGVYNNIPVKFFDLPLAHSFALKSEVKEEQNEPDETSPSPIAKDPFSYLAEAAGFEDGEWWWEMNFEKRLNNESAFEAVKEAMTALRSSLPATTDKNELLREAWMRKMIRATEKDGYQKIAVICGAWHVPALENMPKVKDDNELLKSLPKVKIESTWIPWTYNRLTYRSGYGAGVLSPGWYHHNWHTPNDDGTLWLTKAAGALRKKNMDTSVAHVIESVRLANTLAALRNYSTPGLDEFNEAITTVMGFGDSMLLQIIKEDLLIGEQIGTVPDEVPKLPLLSDIEKWQKKFRLVPTAAIKELKLDLREENDLAKSTFLHRIKLLGINWGDIVLSRSKGTFKEQWQLLWQPEFTIQLIERGVWGNTLEEAATNYLAYMASETNSASQLVELLEKTVPTDLPESVNAMVKRLDALTATTSDITELMRSMPGLSNVVRYGNVRKTDFQAMRTMLDSMIARICIGVPIVCINIDIDAAQGLLDMLMKTDYALALLKEETQDNLWQEALLKINDSKNSNPLIGGYCSRLLYDKGVVTHEQVQLQLSYYLSAGNNPADAAHWFEGFLKSSGTILLLDTKLWNLVNGWVEQVRDEDFIHLLPVLRRTFAEFTQAERRKLGEKAKQGYIPVSVTQDVTDDFDFDNALKVLPQLKLFAGIKTTL